MIKKCFLDGYWAALDDYGIWKNGERHIGALEVNIKDAFENKKKELEKGTLDKK